MNSHFKIALGASILTLAACGEAAEESAAPVEEASANPVAETAGSEQPEVTGDYDEATVAAAQACHDKVWFEDERFKDLPNAAVSIDPASLSDDDPAIGWTVEWDDPEVSMSGSCMFDGDSVTVAVSD